jgi:hypothetical protein
MNDLSFSSPSADELRAIQQRANELRAEAFSAGVRKVIRSLSALTRVLHLSPTCARPLRSH